MTDTGLEQLHIPDVASVAVEPPALVQPSVSAGKSLADKRVALKLTFDDVTARLKYSRRLIESLESDRVDELPSGLSLRGLIRNYTRLLGMDSQPIEEALKDRIGMIGGTIANHTSTRSLAAHEPERPQQSSIGWVVLIALVVIAALAIAIWQGVVPRAMLPQWLGSMLQ